MTPSRAYFSLPGDETRSGAQDLRRGLRHSARSNRPWSAPKDQGLSGTRQPVDHPEAPRRVLIRHKSASDASTQGADHGYV